LISLTVHSCILGCFINNFYVRKGVGKSLISSIGDVLIINKGIKIKTLAL